MPSIWRELKTMDNNQQQPKELPDKPKKHKKPRYWRKKRPLAKRLSSQTNTSSEAQGSTDELSLLTDTDIQVSILTDEVPENQVSLTTPQVPSQSATDNEISVVQSPIPQGKARKASKQHTSPKPSSQTTPADTTTKRILINACYADEKRVAILQGGKLYDFYSELASRQSLKGNIYKGTVVSVLPSLQAVFVDFGQKRHGFLKFKEIMPELYKDTSSEGKKKIHQLIQKGQELIVQVDKDQHDTKGASLTTYISLAGRYIVMMPGQNKVGISRKIEARDDRDRLKEIFKSLKLPKDMGFILRTASGDSMLSELKSDLKYLTRLYTNIKLQAQKAKAPALIYQEQDLALRIVRDYLTSDVTEIIVDDKATYNALKAYVKKIIPDRHINIVHYKDKVPLFSLYNIDAQVAKLSEQYVTLPSKGYLVFGKTEALTAIDVNSGKSNTEGDLEATALKTNLEAVAEIARQLRLRDIGGLIVIDFIDMQSGKNRRLIEQKMSEALSADKAHYEIAPLSKFCILEMTRERLMPAYAETISTKCEHCGGSGTVKTAEATAILALREMHHKVATTNDISGITCRLATSSANILLNNLRHELIKIEKDFGTKLTVLADVNIPKGQYKIEFIKA